MNGHSDVIMGAAITNREDIANRLRFLQNGNIIIYFSLIFVLFVSNFLIIFSYGRCFITSRLFFS